MALTQVFLQCVCFTLVVITFYIYFPRFQPVQLPITQLEAMTTHSSPVSISHPHIHHKQRSSLAVIENNFDQGLQDLTIDSLTEVPETQSDTFINGIGSMGTHQGMFRRINTNGSLIDVDGEILSINVEPQPTISTANEHHVTFQQPDELSSTTTIPIDNGDANEWRNAKIIRVWMIIGMIALFISTLRAFYSENVEREHVANGLGLISVFMTFLQFLPQIIYTWTRKVNYNQKFLHLGERRIIFMDASDSMSRIFPLHVQSYYTNWHQLD